MLISPFENKNIKVYGEIDYILDKKEVAEIKRCMGDEWPFREEEKLSVDESEDGVILNEQRQSDSSDECD